VITFCHKPDCGSIQSFVSWVDFQHPVKKKPNNIIN
jgi:hypothetical protein